MPARSVSFSLLYFSYLGFLKSFLFLYFSVLLAYLLCLQDILDCFKWSRKQNPLLQIEQNVKKIAFFFFFGVLNLFPFVRVAKKMYTNPGKKV